MTAYVYPNFPSKVALHRALEAGERVTCSENTPWGTKPIIEGKPCVCGPHYPKPHKWYGQVTVTAGIVTSVE